MRSTYADLLSLAVWASLHDSHQVGMLALLLRLCSSSSRASYVDSVLSHDGETRQSDLGLLGVLLWLLRNSSSAVGWRSHAEGTVCGITKGSCRARALRDDWRQARSLGDWALFKGGIGPLREDIVGAGESAGVEVNGGIVVEVNGDFGQLVLLGSGTSNIEVNHLLEFLRA